MKDLTNEYLKLAKILEAPSGLMAEMYVFEAKDVINEANEISKKYCGDTREKNWPLRELPPTEIKNFRVLYIAKCVNAMEVDFLLPVMLIDGEFEWDPALILETHGMIVKKMHFPDAMGDFYTDDLIPKSDKIVPRS